MRKQPLERAMPVPEVSHETALFMSEKTETHYCRFLRGKNAYGTLEGGDRPFLSIDPATTYYWCIRTAGPVGPDDRPVHGLLCNRPDRTCFRERLDTKKREKE